MSKKQFIFHKAHYFLKSIGRVDYTISYSNLVKHERTDIVDTFGIFKFSENITSCMERLKNYFKGVKNILEVSFNTSKKHCHNQDIC